MNMVRTAVIVIIIVASIRPCAAQVDSVVGSAQHPLEPMTLAQRQKQSVADKYITSENFGHFRDATQSAAISPVLKQSVPSDRRIEYRGIEGLEDIAVVVRKPRTVGGVYEIPYLPDGADVGRFLKEHLEEAADAKVGLIKFPPFQTFAVRPASSGGRHLKLEGFRDATIDLNGSVIELLSPSLGILIQDCQRIVIKNGRIKGSTMLASIAKVLFDESLSGFKLEVLPEFRERLLSESTASPKLFTVGTADQDPSGLWGLRLDGYHEIFVNRELRLDRFVYSPRDFAFVCTSPVKSAKGFLVGEDFVWLQHQNNLGHAVLLDNEMAPGNEDITFEQLSFQNIPGMVIAGEVVRGLHVDRVTIERSESDPTAIFAAASDGIHINGNGGDIIIENSVFGPNADDKINIKGNYWRVQTIDRPHDRIVVVPAERSTSVNRWGWQKQKVAFIKPDFSIIGLAEMASDSLRDNGKRHDLVLDDIPEGVEAGSLVGNVDNSGSRVIIRNNVFQSTRAQGVLIQSSHVVVQNNRFSQIAGPAIKLNLSLNDWFESINVSNVLIDGNQFFHCAQNPKKSLDVISFHQLAGDESPVNAIDDVKIIGNTLTESPSIKP